MIKKISTLAIIAILVSSCGTSTRTTASKSKNSTNTSSTNKKKLVGTTAKEMSNKKTNETLRTVSKIDSKTAVTKSKTQVVKKVK